MVEILLVLKIDTLIRKAAKSHPKPHCRLRNPVAYALKHTGLGLLHMSEYPNPEQPAFLTGLWSTIL